MHCTYKSFLYPRAAALQQTSDGWNSQITVVTLVAMQGPRDRGGCWIFGRILNLPNKVEISTFYFNFSKESQNFRNFSKIFAKSVKKPAKKGRFFTHFSQWVPDFGLSAEVSWC